MNTWWIWIQSLQVRMGNPFFRRGDLRPIHDFTRTNSLEVVLPIHITPVVFPKQKTYTTTTTTTPFLWKKKTTNQLIPQKSQHQAAAP